MIPALIANLALIVGVPLLFLYFCLTFDRK